MSKSNALFFPLTILGYAALIHAAAAPAHSKIAHKFHADGNDGWDFLTVDEGTGRLFISHGTQVQVMDEKDGRLLGTIPDTKGVHGIALAPGLNKGFISNGKDTSVTVFDLKTLATIGKVRVTGINPDAILFDPSSQDVFAFNGKTSNVTVIDASTGAVVATIPLEGKPEVAVSDGAGSVYVNLEDKSMVAAIDAKAKKVTGSWPIAPGESPSGLAIDLLKGRLFMVCENKLMVVFDLKTHKVLASLPIGDKVDGVGYDPIKKRAYASNGEGTLTIVQEDVKGDYKVLETLPTQRGAKTIAVDNKTQHVFMSTAEMPKPRPTVKPGTFVILDVEPST
jgi:YVTN family beta-propeller protein